MFQKKSLAKALRMLRAKFESSDILNAVDHFDEVRPVISDHEFRPPEIRDKLLKLHSETMHLINYTGEKDQERLDEILYAVEEIDSEILDCLDNLKKVHRTLAKLAHFGGYDPD